METELKKLRNKYNMIRNDLFTKLGEKGASTNEDDVVDVAKISGKIRMLDIVINDLDKLLR